MAVTLTNQSPYHSLKAHKTETIYKSISSTATNLMLKNYVFNQKKLKFGYNSHCIYWLLAEALKRGIKMIKCS